MFLGIGTILGGLIVVGLFFRRLNVWHTLLAFAAGVLLAGSLVGHFVQVGAETGAGVVQQVGNGIANADTSSTSKAPARPTPARAVRKP